MRDHHGLDVLLAAADRDLELPSGVEDAILALVIAGSAGPATREPAGDGQPTTPEAEDAASTIDTPPPPGHQMSVWLRPGAMLAAALALLASAWVVGLGWRAAPPVPRIEPLGPAATSEIAERTTVDALGVPFSVDLGAAGEPLERRSATLGEDVVFASPSGSLLAFVTAGPPTIDEWVRRFDDVEGASVTEPFITHVGNVPAVAVDVISPEPVVMYRTGGIDEIPFAATGAMRIHVLDLGDHNVSVLAVATLEDFPVWLRRTGQILDSSIWAQSSGASDLASADRLFDDRFAVDFSMPRSARGMTLKPWPPNPGVEAPYTTVDGTVLIFLTTGPPTIEGWRAKFDGAEGATLSDTFGTMVGGHPGVAFDAAVGADHVFLYDAWTDVGPYSDFQLSREPVGGYCPECLFGGDTARIHLVDVEGTAIAIIAAAPADIRAQWVAASTDILHGIRWGDTEE